jgi:glutamate racemase
MKDGEYSFPKPEDPIGVLDSGMGGISTLRELIRKMPSENYIFLGDDAHAPYGTKTQDEVIRLTENCVCYLLEKGAKAIVIGCNTATGVAAAYLREKYPQVIIVGAEPALRPAVRIAITKMPNPTILVMATPLTLQSLKFCHLAEQFEGVSRIIRLPCPGLVEFVEQGILEGELLDKRLHELLDPCKDFVDAVVLGCTHYPFLKSSISKIFQDKIPLYDGNAGIASETQRRLSNLGLLNKSSDKGTVRLVTSSQSEETEKIAYRLLNL